MSADVPVVPELPSKLDVVIGRAVRGPTWRRMGSSLNWMLGRGATLVAGYSPGSSAGTIPKNESRTYRFFIAPRLQTLRRLWVFQFRKIVTGSEQGGAAGSTDALEVRVDTVLLASVTVATASARESTLVVEELASQGSTPVEVAVELTNTDATFGVECQWIACYELPRFELATTAAEGGVNAGSLVPRGPVYDTDGHSGGGVKRAVNLVATTVRRASLFAWSVDRDQSSDIVSSTTATPVSIFPDPVPILGRKTVSGTDTSVRVYALVRAVSGATVRLTVTSNLAGDTETPETTSSSWTWISADVQVQAEDLSTSDGVAGTTGTWETVNFQLSNPAVTGDAELAAICVDEV